MTYIHLMNNQTLVPREQVLQTLWERLENGSLLVYGPRRVGKSTLLDTIEEQPKEGWVAVRVDIEGCQDIPTFVAKIRDRLRVHKLISDADGLAGRIESVEIVGVGAGLRAKESRGDWELLRDVLRESVLKLPAETRLLIALDELPWWLDAVADGAGKPTARAALATLRSLRQERPLSERIRWVLTGSIGLAGLAADLNASAELNDLDTMEVGPLDPAQAATLFEMELTAVGKTCDPVVAAYAARLAGGIPHWVKVLASRVREPGARGTADIDAAAERLLEPQLRKSFSDEGAEHLRRRHPDRVVAMTAILEALSGADVGGSLQGAITAAQAAQPELSHKAARDCIYLLIDGYYLHEHGDGSLSWVNPLFRRWWLRYGGL